MNLSPTWVMVLEEAGFEVLHWSKVGKPSASDHEIFDWAASNGYVIITHNGLWDHSRAFLRSRSFSSANSGKRSPDALQTILVAAIRSTEADLGKGALVTLDVPGPRIRLLPLEGQVLQGRQHSESCSR